MLNTKHAKIRNHKEVNFMEIWPAWGPCLLRSYCVFTYTSVIKVEVLESSWWGFFLWLTTLPRHCESCQPACIYCWPAVTMLTHTLAGLPFNSPLLLHPWLTQHDGSPSHVCVWGLGRGRRCVRGRAYVCACIHTCKVFIGEAFSSHICTSLILRETPPSPLGKVGNN